MAEESVLSGDEQLRIGREQYESATDFTVAIEEELAIRDPETLALTNRFEELKASAEESIDELRRNLQMLREDFDLIQGISDYVKTFRDRTQLDVSFEKSGLPETPHHKNPIDR